MCSLRGPFIIALFALLVITLCRAQESQDEVFWQFLATDLEETRGGREPWVRPIRGDTLRLDANGLRRHLQSHSGNPLEIAIPVPGEKLERFRIVDSEVMHPELATKFPEIKAYRGEGVDDKAAALRLDVTPRGFHAQVLSPRAAFYIDPCWKGDDTTYVCYRKRDLAPKAFHCGVGHQEDALLERAAALTAIRPLAAITNGATLRTYRLAVTAQGEYTQFHGGTVTGAMAAIVSTINRVNGIYERDLGIRLQLVPNNNLIVYTNPATDPFSANDSSGATLTENQTNTDAVIGSANYDVGHIFNAGGGGLASFGVVCHSDQKAEGATGSPSPTGDAFDVDFVAHELGHQFSASHTFNGTADSCSGNRDASAAYEKGSGSTIMSYVGICGSDNLQSQADPYFHAGSIAEILSFVQTETCEVATATGNFPPDVDAGADFMIPAQTPFTLSATGSDANGDTLTYTWEQMDLGPAQALSAPDNGLSPLFRSFSPIADRTRTFPKLADILSNISNDAERLPTLARTMKFRVTARDNRLNGGGIDSDDMTVTVVETAGPFQVSFPNASESLSGSQTITWDPAATHLAPINASQVHILLSLDGGLSFPNFLVLNTPNDGSETVTLPNIHNATARIKILGANNIFFDISNSNFTISPALPNYIDGGNPMISDLGGTGNGNGYMDPGETGLALFLNVKNDSAFAATGLSATLSSLSSTATVTVSQSTYPDLGANETENNDTAFRLDLDSSHPCGDPVLLRLSIEGNELNDTVDFSLSTGGPGSPMTLPYATATAIPDAGMTEVTFSVNGVGTITDLDFRLDGSVCSTDPSSTLVGLNHSWVGDLTMTLISPGGTEVVIMDRPGNGSSGRNFCQTLFNDDGAFPNIQSIDQDGADEPHTGTFLPANPLSAFDGEDADGQWTLRLQDHFSPDTGQLNAFSMIVTGITCAAPVQDAYDLWAQASGLTGLDAYFDQDPNEDNLPNGLAFYLGAANAQADANDLFPEWGTIVIDEVEYVNVVFPRIDAANDLAAEVRHSTDLDVWHLAQHGVNGVIVLEIIDGIGVGIDEIIVRIPLDGAVRRFVTITIPE